jgi:hypothetical protein
MRFFEVMGRIECGLAASRFIGLVGQGQAFLYWSGADERNRHSPELLPESERRI